MQAPEGSERRKYQRLLGAYFVYYKIKGPSENYELSRTKDISRGGMLLTLDKSFKEGTNMAFVIRGPFTPGATIEMTGVVLESREVVKGFVYKTRIKFSDSDIKLLDKLDEFIKQRPDDR